MKKHIIAAAVAAAVAVPAMAQNVSIGGNFDMSYDFGDQNATTQLLNAAGAFTTSAITISGTEDLGGGLKAYFNVNSRLGNGNLISGATGSKEATQDKVSDRAGAINFGDRGFQVGITGAFGDVAIGKTTGTAFGGTIRGGVAGNFSLLSESRWGDRPNNMISYTTPAFNGLKGRAIYQTSGGNFRDGDSNGSYELSLNYVNGPLTVDAAYNKVKAGAYTDSNDEADATVAGSDTGVRAQYNFGSFAANLSYINNETAAASTRRQWSAGVTVPLGNINLLAEYGKRDAAASSTGDGFYNVGAVYNLSKRTNVYAVYNKLRDATGTGKSIADSDENADSTADTARYVVGIRHSF